MCYFLDKIACRFLLILVYLVILLLRIVKRFGQLVDLVLYE